MNEDKSDSDKWWWMVALGGPVSWLVVSALAWLASRGPDGGWAGMGIMFTGLGLILVLHVAAPVVLAVAAVRRRRSRHPIGKAIVTGLSYYGLVAVATLMVLGPRGLMSDSIVVLESLFGK